MSFTFTFNLFPVLYINDSFVAHAFNSRFVDLLRIDSHDSYHFPCVFFFPFYVRIVVFTFSRDIEFTFAISC